MLRTQQFGWAVCALLVFTSSVGTAHAQRGGGMRMQNVSRVQLATLSEVEADTKLTADQKSLAKSSKEKLDAKRAEMRGGGGGGGGGQEARAALAKFTSELDSEFSAKLDDGQKKRFNGLLLQVNGVSAVLDTQVSKELGLSEDTVKKLKSVNQENQAARREAMQSAQNDREAAAAAMRKLSEKSDADLLAVLSDAEKKKVEELKGSKLEIDMAPLRPNRQ